MFMSHAARNGHDPLGSMASPGNINYAARASSPIPIGGREAIYPLHVLVRMQMHSVGVHDVCFLSITLSRLRFV